MCSAIFIIYCNPKTWAWKQVKFKKNPMKNSVPKWSRFGNWFGISRDPPPVSMHKCHRVGYTRKPFLWQDNAISLASSGQLSRRRSFSFFGRLMMARRSLLLVGRYQNGGSFVWIRGWVWGITMFMVPTEPAGLCNQRPAGPLPGSVSLGAVSPRWQLTSVPAPWRSRSHWRLAPWVRL